jgi:hypothetical protein
MLHELFVLGHVSFVWLFAGYFWDLCLLLELFVLGHVNCVFTVLVHLAHGFLFSCDVLVLCLLEFAL